MLIRLGVKLSIALYVVAVAIMLLLRSMGAVWGLPEMPELLYGPAITIASVWIIFVVVFALMGNRHDA